jgi:hypothetical protein
MSAIDFSRVVTAEARAAAAALDRAAAMRAECRRRILAAIPFEAQSNIAQAVTVYTAELVRGGTVAEAEAASGLADADLPVAGAGRRWIAGMQAACRALATDPAADPAEEAAWPPLPEGVADLVARF